jgi:hypothetical protein
MSAAHKSADRDDHDDERKRRDQIKVAGIVVIPIA